MLKDVLPEASTVDVQHFQAMMDIDKNNLISLQEFTQTLAANQAIHVQVNFGRLLLFY